LTLKPAAEPKHECQWLLLEDSDRGATNTVDKVRRAIATEDQMRDSAKFGLCIVCRSSRHLHCDQGVDAGQPLHLVQSHRILNLDEHSRRNFLVTSQQQQADDNSQRYDQDTLQATGSAHRLSHFVLNVMQELHTMGGSLPSLYLEQPSKVLGIRGPGEIRKLEDHSADLGSFWFASQLTSVFG